MLDAVGSNGTTSSQSQINNVHSTALRVAKLASGMALEPHPPLPTTAAGSSAERRREPTKLFQRRLCEKTLLLSQLPQQVTQQRPVG